MKEKKEYKIKNILSVLSHNNICYRFKRKNNLNSLRFAFSKRGKPKKTEIVMFTVELEMEE